MKKKLLRLIKNKTRLLTVSLEEDCVRFLEVTIKNKQIQTIHQAFSLKHSMIGDGGKLDKGQWEEILKQQVKEYKIKAKLVHIVIPSSLVIVRHQAMPDVPEKDLKQMVQFEIGTSIHLPFDLPIVDLVKLKSDQPVYNDEGELASSVMIVAAPGDLIYPMVEILQENGFKPKYVDIPALSLYRIFSAIHENKKDDPILLVNISRFGVDLHIFANSILWFTRHYEMAIDSFVKRQEQIKEFAEVEEESSKQEVLNGKIYDAKTLLDRIQEKENYQSFVTELGHEIERAINFFRFTLNHQDQKINHCYISSLFDLPIEFYNQIQERLDMEVHSLRYTSENKKLETERLLGYEVGIGMLFREVVE